MTGLLLLRCRRLEQSSTWCEGISYSLLCGAQAVAIPGNYVFDTVTIVSHIPSCTYPLPLSSDVHVLECKHTTPCASGEHRAGACCACLATRAWSGRSFMSSESHDGNADQVHTHHICSSDHHSRPSFHYTSVYHIGSCHHFRSRFYTIGPLSISSVQGRRHHGSIDRPRNGEISSAILLWGRC